MGLTQRCTNYWLSLQGVSCLAMSTPPVLSNAVGNCGEYKPHCVGDDQKVLFYIALALIAIGISGHITSLESFLNQQQEDNSEQLRPLQAAGGLGVILLPIVGCIALPYIRPWSVRFGIPAICTVVATFLFTTGSCLYRRTEPQGSPLTTLCRVFVASASNMCRHLPSNDNQVPRTRGLWFSLSLSLSLSQPRNLMIRSHYLETQVPTFLHLTEFRKYNDLTNVHDSCL